MRFKSPAEEARLEEGTSFVFLFTKKEEPCETYRDAAQQKCCRNASSRRTSAKDCRHNAKQEQLLGLAPLIGGETSPDLNNENAGYCCAPYGSSILTNSNPLTKERICQQARRKGNGGLRYLTHRSSFSLF